MVLKVGGEKAGKPEDKDAETTSVWRLTEASTVLIPLRGGVI